MSNKNTLLTICSPPIYRRFKGGLLNKKTFPARQRLSRGFAKAQVQIPEICKNQYVTNQNYFRHWLVQIKNSQADAGMLKKATLISSPIPSSWPHALLPPEKPHLLASSMHCLRLARNRVGLSP